MRDLGQKKKKKGRQQGKAHARECYKQRCYCVQKARNQRQCDVVSKGMRSRKLRFRDKEEASGK